MTFEVSIFSRNLDVSESLNEQIIRKVTGLGRYLDEIDEARVDLASTNARSAEEREVVQITIHGKGFILRAEEKRYKGKRNQRWKQGKEVSEIIENGEEEIVMPVIARRKQFSVRPMDEWEAIEQMELLGHNDFFVFYNAQTEGINVLYRRYDGTYGLIQPVIG